MGIRWVWTAAAVSLACWGCAAGGDLDDNRPAGQGGTTSSGGAAGSGTAGSAGTAGQGGSGAVAGSAAQGGSAGTAGTAGAGGSSGGSGGSSGGTGGSSGGVAGTSGAAGSAGAAGAGGAGGSAGTSGTGGSAPTEALIVAGLQGSVVTRGFHVGSSWTSDTVAQTTDAGCAVTAGKLGGLVVMRAVGNQLRYMTVDTVGNWSALADVGSGTTRATPAATTTSNGIHHLVFHGEDFKYYSADFSAGAWSSSFTNVGNPQAFGPLEVGIAARDAAYSIAYKGDNTRLITQAFSGIWDPTGTDQGSSTVMGGVPPAIAGRAADYVAVYARGSDQTLQWISGVNGAAWSAPQAVGGPATDRAMAITATDAGDVVVAWVSGTDQSLWAAKLTGTTWDVVQVDTFGQQGSPALAPGVNGHDAEMVFLRGSALQHVSLTGSTWSSPVPIASGSFVFAGLARMRW